MTPIPIWTTALYRRPAPRSAGRRRRHPGFEEFVEAMAKPRHPERKRLIEWYGRVFKPEDINLSAVQANIAKLARRRAIGKPLSPKAGNQQAERANAGRSPLRCR